MNLTPLAALAGFDAETCAALAPYWISSAEEFIAVARGPNRGHGDGLTALRQALGWSQERAGHLLHAAETAAPGFAFSPPQTLDLGTGGLLDSLEQLAPPSSPVPPVALAEVRLDTHLPPPGQQGRRNSGVAFALVALYQIISGDATDLSEQFLYWAARDGDTTPGDEGARLELALRRFAERGVCAEQTWPYNNVPDQNNPGQGPPPPGAVEEARTRRITGFSLLPPRDVATFQDALANRRPILIGLTVREHWLNVWPAYTLGRVRCPLPGEAVRGRHVMVVVGYRLDKSAPGGGYFIVRNSWGTAWGRENPDGAGYAHLPFQLISEANSVAITIDGISQTPSGEGTVGSSFAPSTNIAAELVALRGEAVALRDRLDALVARLSALLPAAPAMVPLPGADAAVEAARRVGGELSPAAGDEPTDDLSLPTAERGYYEIVANADPATQVLLAPNGIEAHSGLPLLRIDAVGGAHLARQTPDPHDLRLLQKSRARSDDVLPPDDDLAVSGWALLVNEEEDAALLTALEPLITYRAREQGLTPPALEVRDGERCGEWLRRKTLQPNNPLHDGIPVLLYRHGERYEAWLERHRGSASATAPRRGLPFYLLIAARPGPCAENDYAFVPAGFQYALDLFFGAGRICFTDAAGAHDLMAYAAYARNLVAFEQGQVAPRSVAFFAPHHPNEPVSKAMAESLVELLATGREGQPGAATRAGFTTRKRLGSEATRPALLELLRPTTEARPPAILVAATHGLALAHDDPQLPMRQGALICQEWPGTGAVAANHCLSAADLDDGTIPPGLVILAAASYAAGCPQHDPQLPADQGRLAPYALVAALPQRMLASGALAFIGQSDRGWADSYLAQGAPDRVEAFAGVLELLMAGGRLGRAVDKLNFWQSALGRRFGELVDQALFGRTVDEVELGRLWAARSDALAYTLLGDPAARLRFV